MKIQEVKKIICIIFMFGFFTGIIYLNIFAKSYLVSMNVFDQYFLEQYSGSSLNTSEYIWHIIKLRMFPVVFLSILTATNFRRIAGSVFLIWTGFSSGVILTTAVFKLGIKGILLCIVGILPHFICYITAMLILLMYLFHYPNTRWNGTKTVYIILFMLLGIITESYINPVLMDMCIKAI